MYVEHLDPEVQATEQDRDERDTAIAEQLIASLLVKPGSKVDELLRWPDGPDCDDEWTLDMRALIRRAADPMADRTKLGADFQRAVNAAIYRAAYDMARVPA